MANINAFAALVKLSFDQITPQPNLLFDENTSKKLKEPKIDLDHGC